jgi:CopG antitoxin of type II toxin-antitoxin system
MGKSKSTISKARTYQEIGEFWDTHDLSEYWDHTKPVEFEVDIQSEAIYYPIEQKLSAQISRIAKRRGVSPETLLNLWLQEKVGEETAAK